MLPCRAVSATCRGAGVTLPCRALPRSGLQGQPWPPEPKRVSTGGVHVHSMLDYVQESEGGREGGVSSLARF